MSYTWESLAEMGHSPKMIEAMLDEQENEAKKTRMIITESLDCSDMEK
jgi:hypothetical protein